LEIYKRLSFNFPLASCRVRVFKFESGGGVGGGCEGINNEINKKRRKKLS